MAYLPPPPLGVIPKDDPVACPEPECCWFGIVWDCALGRGEHGELLCPMCFTPIVEADEPIIV